MSRIEPSELDHDRQVTICPHTGVVAIMRTAGDPEEAPAVLYPAEFKLVTDLMEVAVQHRGRFIKPKPQSAEGE